MKSDISSFELDYLMSLMIAVIKDTSDWLEVSSERDIEVINTRVRHEGISFMTKTLPSFAKTILSGLRDGVLVLPNDFPFKRKRRRGVQPAFLQAILNFIFDEVGVVRPDADPHAVAAIEQICFLFYKYELPYSARQLEKAFANLKSVNDSLPITISEVASAGWEDDLILVVAETLIGELFDDFSIDNIVPKQGKGATAEGTVPGYEKYNFRRPTYPRTEEIFPFDSWFCLPSYEPCTSIVPAVYAGAGASEGFSDLVGSSALDEISAMYEPIAKLCSVPKDSRAPRIISAEPKELMWLQQGIWKYMRKRIEGHALTRGHVNFTDQQVNRDLALVSSLTQEWATLDMKEASDRISLAVVFDLFPETLRDSLLACRSIYNKFPEGGGLLSLRKFAPMGSAVCFPVESVVFWALCIGILVRIHGLPPNKAIKSVYVYGDDIIIPTQYAASVAEYLGHFSLLCNEEKSYWSGNYRESCGLNAFKGVETTPLRIKKRLPLRQKDAESIAGWVEYSNNFYRRGLWRAASLIQKYIERTVLHKTLPVLPEYSNGLGWFSYCGEYDPLDKSWLPVPRPKLAGRCIAKGHGFEMYHMSSLRPFRGQKALRRKCFILHNKSYVASPEQFSEEKAYLRALTQPTECSSRVFSDRRSVVLRYDWVYFS